jgi:hypothetical protein
MPEETQSSAAGSAMPGPLPRFAFIAATTALYLCLPVLGWGGLAPFLSHPALVAAALATLLLAFVSFFSGGNISTGVREDRGNRWVIAVFGVIGLLDGYLPAWADRHGFWTIDGDTVRWAGVALFAAGGALLAVMRAVLDGQASKRADRHHAEGIMRLFGLSVEDAAEVAARPMPGPP